MSADNQLDNVFRHFHRALAFHRDSAVSFAELECTRSLLPERAKFKTRENFVAGVDKWAQELLRDAWVVCYGREKDACPPLRPSLAFTEPLPTRPPTEILEAALSTIVFLHITTSSHYSAQTRSFVSTFGPVNESLVISSLRNPQPDKPSDDWQQRTQETTANHASRGKALRYVGMGVGALAGGVLIGVTGGLAAPLVGAGVSTVLGWLGVGGTAMGLVASGLAGSSVVCGAVFGVYGAKEMGSMVRRHTREVKDLELVPIVREERERGKEGRDNEDASIGENALAIRLCVSGWLNDKDDVTAPWKMFSNGDTFALQWEVEALQELSTALTTLAKSSAMKVVKVEIIKRTVFNALMMSLAPMALAHIGRIIDNPWMNSRALAIKAGRVLGDLLSNRVFGNRPVTLVGYSLGSLVIYHALLYLLELPNDETTPLSDSHKSSTSTTAPPSGTLHLIQDMYIFGSPIPIDIPTWTSIRRMVAGRIVNGYSNDDYVLAVLCRATAIASGGKWDIAGLREVGVSGVENVLCDGVEGHTQWRGKVEEVLRERCGM